MCFNDTALLFFVSSLILCVFQPLECRLGTDTSHRGLYAIVMMESYIDVLKCINSLHGVRYEGKTLDVKKVA